MKFSQIAKGKRAVRRARLPLVNVRCPLLPDVPELAEQRQKDHAAFEAAQSAPSTDSGGRGFVASAAPDAAVEVGLRVLTGEEHADVLERARAFALGRHAEARDGDPLYDLGRAVYTLELACVDPEHRDPDALEARFFDSAEQILASEHIGRDGIAYLFECQERWQDECSPQALVLEPQRFEQLVVEVADSVTSDPFDRMRPGMQWTFARTLAALHVSSQRARSPSSTGSATSNGDGKTGPTRPSDNVVA